MHWEKASALAGAELLGEPDPLADDPTRATPGPDGLCEQAVASSATTTSPTANPPERRTLATAGILHT
jgi:hypothetical protein